MANGHGGYRRPTQPAAVSGPGKFSRRTDGGPQPVRDLADARYGENKAYVEAQQAAPMSGGGGIPEAAVPPVSGLPDLSGIVPFGAPSQRPEEPVTAGTPFGPGGGSTANLGPGNLTPEQAARLQSYLPVLIVLASQPDADPQTKKFVRQLRGELG